MQRNSLLSFIIIGAEIGVESEASFPKRSFKGISLPFLGHLLLIFDSSKQIGFHAIRFYFSFGPNFSQFHIPFQLASAKSAELFKNLFYLQGRLLISRFCLLEIPLYYSMQASVACKPISTHIT